MCIRDRHCHVSDFKEVACEVNVHVRFLCILDFLLVRSLSLDFLDFHFLFSHITFQLLKYSGDFKTKNWMEPLYLSLIHISEPT